MRTTASMLSGLCMVSLIGCAVDTASSAPPSTGDDSQVQELLQQFPDATQVDDHSISWNDGKVVLVLLNRSADELSAEPDGTEVSSLDVSSQALANAHGCPSGWYCVYQDINWGVRRLQFSDCTRNDLSNFGFRDQTSSWVNNGSLTVQVKNDLTLQPDQVLWTMPPQSTSAFVGAAANDKADYFQCL